MNHESLGCIPGLTLCRDFHELARYRTRTFYETQTILRGLSQAKEVARRRLIVGSWASDGITKQVAIDDRAINGQETTEIQAHTVSDVQTTNNLTDGATSVVWKITVVGCDVVARH